MTYEITPLTEASLTSRVVNGTGLFDGLMQSVAAHLKSEYEKNRLSGAEYTKAWIAAMEAAMANSVQYLLQKDQAYLQALQVQAQVDKLHYELTNILPQEVIKLQKEIQQVELENDKLAYEVDFLMPKELDKANKAIETMTAEISSTTAKTNQTLYQTANLLPLQKTELEKDVAIKTYTLATQMPAQVAGIEADTLGKTYNNNYILPATLASINEQTEGHRAKTLSTRRDGTPVAGAIGMQIALQAEQITSYKRDAETKFAKMLVDTWTVQKSIDEGLNAPTQLQDPALNTVMSKLRTNMGLS